ncbi:MAG: hypothetical protein KA365_03705, partial [Arenimonas sp.]|nr:hypothetical protein [Arenimonas sp.]
MKTVMAATLMLALVACSNDAEQKGPGKGGMPPTLVDTYTVLAREIPNTLKAVGSIRAIESIEVRPEV